jgi:hypothetical protein
MHFYTKGNAMTALAQDQWEDQLVNYNAPSDNGNVIEHAARLPTHDEIQARAYDIYQRHGCQEGHCEENWLEAERELVEELRDEEVVSASVAKNIL